MFTRACVILLIVLSLPSPALWDNLSQLSNMIFHGRNRPGPVTGKSTNIEDQPATSRERDEDRRDDELRRDDWKRDQFEFGHPEWARLSPFTDVIFKGKDGIVVEFEHKQYELVSIDGLTTKRILDSARNQYSELWKKRFAEDLVEVMTGAGRKPEQTVKLVLQDLKSKKLKTVAKAPLTSSNRQSVYRAVNSRPGYRRFNVD